MREYLGPLLLLLSGLALLIAVMGLGFESSHTPSSMGPSSRSQLPTPELLVGQAGGRLATLLRFERAVRSKRSDELVWQQAHEEMPLYGNDSVRTFDRSRASILFGRADVVEVEENTLMIITARWNQSENEISMALLSPALLRKIEEQPAEDRERMLHDAMASRNVRVVNLPGDGARIGVKTLTDERSAIVSHAGTVKLIGSDGAEVVLDESMATMLGPGGTLTAPRKLLRAPTLAAPRDGTSYAFQRQAPRVKLRWGPVDGADTYRILVARDEAFENLFVDEKLDGTTLIAGNVEPGSYYWRVRAEDVDGIAGPFSRTRALETTRDDTPPPLMIAHPPEMFVSSEPRVEIRGETDRSASVRINGHAVPVSDAGGFSHSLEVREGSMLVTVEAIDQAGNVEYGTRLITYRGKRAPVAMLSEKP